MLSDSDSDSESSTSIHQLTINEHYEKAFNARKEREELDKLKEKLGSDATEGDEETDSESDETEDELGEELTPAADVAILRTLAKIKNKDPKIYEKGLNVFDEEHAKQDSFLKKKRPKPKEAKPIKLKEHIMHSILNPTSRSPSPEPQPLTHVEEQAALRTETINAFQHAVSEDESDDILIPREKTKDELEREEEEYAEFLKREVGEDLDNLVEVEKVDEEAAEVTGERETNKKRKNGAKSGKSKEEENQQFLINYILNRGWIDKSEGRVPTYNEITSGNKPESDAESKGPNDELFEEDDEFEEIAEEFETSYNFRFEEPNADAIQRFPRSIPSTVRRADTTRIEARERRKQRKEAEKLQKKEEVKRLKALKRKELQTKLERIGKEGGLDLGEEDLGVIDLDGDWDPEAHDKQMAGLYDESKLVEDTEKPIWDEDIEIDDIIPPEPSSSKKKKKKKKKKDKERGDSMNEDGVDVDEMDADVEPVAQDDDEEEEEWDGTEEMRKRKFDEYMDELYKLEFNDMVGGMPTRFNYVPVGVQTFGLAPAEILLADDKDLNEYVGLKKIAPFRKDKNRGWDSKRTERLKEFREKFKLKDRRWGYGGRRDAVGENENERSKKRRIGKKERQKMKEINLVEDSKEAEV